MRKLLIAFIALLLISCANVINQPKLGKYRAEMITKDGSILPFKFEFLKKSEQLIMKVENGEFRADLFFRINVLPINVPSLAERRTDIPSLQKTLLNNLKVDEVQKPIFTPDAITALCKHNWPGNVRELKNVIERACIIFPGKEITSTNIYENLLRLKVPTVAEEQEALWDMTSDLSGITNLEEKETINNLEDYLPHPKNYKNTIISMRTNAELFASFLQRRKTSLR